MGPGRFGGIGPSSAVVLATLVVAMAVVAVVWIDGGLSQPLVTQPPRVAAAAAPPSQG